MSAQTHLPTPGAGYVALAERGIVALRGAAARSFLQGLISNDVDKVTPEQAIHAALLTPQGKYLFDFFVLQEGDDGLLLETEGRRTGPLVQRLMMYRLRTKVQIEDESARFGVAAVLGEGVNDTLGLPPWPGACRRLGDDGFAFVDPRLPALGARVLLPPDALASGLEALGCAPLPPEAYEAHRLRLGVPDGSRDLALERATLLESGFEELNGVDFKKGCFVGQELTARMKYRGLARKRLMPVVLEGPPVEPGTIVRAGGRDAGEMRSSSGEHGLALLRLEHVARARQEGTPLVAETTEIRPQQPGWANFSLD